MTSAAKVCAAFAIALSASAQADPLSAGSTATYTVPGTTSIYQVFGHAGNPGGDYGAATDAISSTFAAGAGNVFTVTASGLISCCSNAPNIPPDGSPGGMSVTGANGLSSLTGNSVIPLVGVFTSETDPNGNAAPGTLNFDANNPASASPLLNQIFYIGDGRTGYNNSVGSLLTFTAPANATRLYIGGIDAYSFNGTTGYYNDNLGSWLVSVTLLGSAVPEPSTWGMMLLGFGAIGIAMRRRKRVMQPA